MSPSNTLFSPLVEDEWGPLTVGGYYYSNERDNGPAVLNPSLSFEELFISDGFRRSPFHEHLSSSRARKKVSFQSIFLCSLIIITIEVKLFCISHPACHVSLIDSIFDFLIMHHIYFFAYAMTHVKVASGRKYSFF